MTFSGYKRKSILSEKTDMSCPFCESKSTISINVIVKYYHFFNIPFLAVGKRGVSKCSNCKQVLSSTEMNDQIKQVYNTIQAKIRIPLVYYIGSILSLILVSYLLLNLFL
jgi:zinc-ribbon family